ncbi:MAG: DUF748 domain-containing protein [Bacteroidales bacterium]|nr:DUF748 domain-containing protein [Bacteroidales bacterium]
MKKWLKITLIILGSILTLILLALIFISPIAKSYVNKHGKDLIGREIHVEKLKVNVFSGTVRIYDFTVFEDDDKTTFFRFDTLDVGVKIRKLLKHELYVDHITLTQLKVRILQDGDRFNFTSIIEHFESEEPEEEDTTSSDWKLYFYNIDIRGGEVYYADVKTNIDWDAKNLNVKVPGVFFDGSKNTDAGIALQLADGGVLRTDASLNMDNNDFNVDLALENFAISNVRAYLTDVMSVSKFDGKLNANVNVAGNLDDILKMNITGDMAFSNVDIRDATGDQVVALKKMAVGVNRINLDENLYDIKSFTVDGLVSHFDLYKTGTNFDRLFATVSTDEAQADDISVDTSTVEAADEGLPLKFKIGTFAVNDATFTYNDFTLPDAFSFPITKLNVKAENLTLNGENNAKIFAQLPNGGSAIINWNGNIDNWKSSQYLSLAIRSLHLKDLSPYSVAYLGHPFTDGTFSFTSENTIKNGQLKGDNKLDLYKPEVGKKRKDVEPEIKIPLRAALYVIKDKDGKVKFDVPVSGNIDSPEFSYMKIVWKTLGNLLVKVATSPFRMVANAFGGSDDIEFVEFDPLQFDFTSEQYNQMSRIADILKTDSAIVVTLTPQMDIAVAAKEQSLFNLKKEYYLSEHPDKATATHLAMIDFANIKAIELKDDGFVDYIKEKGYVEGRKPSESQIREAAERLYPVEESVAQLRRLAEMRNRYVSDYMARSGVPSRQIIVGSINENASKNGYVLTSELVEE